MYMEEHERFDNWLLRFEDAAKRVEATNSHKIGILLREKPIRTIPKRLLEAINKCKLDNLDYDECCVTLSKRDKEQHDSGVVNENAKKRNVNAISNGKCHSCNNDGHDMYQCCLDACKNCLKFKCGHKTHECPNRDNNKRKKNNPDNTGDPAKNKGDKPKGGNPNSNRGRGRSSRGNRGGRFAGNRGGGRGNQRGFRDDRGNNWQPRGSNNFGRGRGNNRGN